MAKVKTVWGIDIGQTALKALELRSVDGQLQVESLDIIEHSMDLSEPDADSGQIIRTALEKFLSQNDVTGSKVCISVPGQSSFTRFVKLPPVEKKKIPDIVRFEADQQIPFPIADVIWRWQTFHDPDSPDVEVGIFAMKRSDIDQTLGYFNAVGMEVDTVQMAPLALYNFMVYDKQVADDGATLLVDIGADKTDLVVADGSRIWTRTIQIGGNNFTEALIKAFKLSASKAEKLKRTAASSKYARQIFQAMRPVFADLVQEIQRSVGYYTSLHREARFRRLIGLGNGFRLPGLQKFLEQNLSIPVVRIDNFNNLKASASISGPTFAENSLAFAVAYGLAVQGLGEATVSTNLLPEQITRAKQWSRKKPMFAAAAATFLIALAIPVLDNYGAMTGSGGDEDLRKPMEVVSNLSSLESQLNRAESAGRPAKEEAQKRFDLFSYRQHIPALHQLILEGIGRRAPQQQWLTSYVVAASDKDRQAALDRIKGVSRENRVMVFITSIDLKYLPNALDAKAIGLRPSAGISDSDEDREDEERGRGSRSARKSRTKKSSSGEKRGYLITITGKTPLPLNRAQQFVNRLIDEWISISQDDPVWTVVDSHVVGYDESSVRSAGSGESSRSARSGRSGRSGRSSRSRRSPRGRFEDYGPEMDERPREAGVVLEDDVPKAEEPDPLFPDDPDEDMAKDIPFALKLVVTMEEPGSEGASAGN